MSRPWMPFYVGDYLADTKHLSTQEHGAYMLLIFHYWQTGSLPADDPRLARIAGLAPKEWAGSRATLASFFEEGWRHKRVEGELTKAQKLSAAGRTGGLASAEARSAKPTIEQRPGNDPPNEPSTNWQALQLHLPSQSKIDNSIGEAKGWSPPRHGATSTAAGRVYVTKGTSDWEAYADDFRKVHRRDPEPNKHGGKWFKTLGEGAP